METLSLPLQNVQQVRCKYSFHLIEHTPFTRFIIFHLYYFFWLALDTPII